MTSSIAYSSAIFSGSRGLAQRAAEDDERGVEALRAQRVTEDRRRRRGFGVMSYAAWPCSVTTTPSKPDRAPSTSSSSMLWIVVVIPSASASSRYGVVTHDA